MERIVQFQKFAVVGVLSTGAQYAVLIGLVDMAGLRPVLASACGYALGAVVNYSLNHRLTFRSARAHRQAIPRFLGVAMTGLMLNSAILWTLNERLSVPYLVAQIVATGVVLVWNFSANRKWTF